MKLKMILFSAAILSALTIGSNQIVKADAVPNTPTTSTSPEKNPVTTGKLGEVTWSLFSDGTLNFSGGTVSGHNPDDDEWPWEKYAEYNNIDIKTINILDKLTLPKDSSGFFFDLSSLTTINGLDKINTSQVTNFGSMFRNDRKLTTLDLSSFNTDQAIDMSLMFDSCISLSSLNVSKFNTSNVTDMARMFYNCSNLLSLDLSNFNTKNVGNPNIYSDNAPGSMQQMFFYDSSLETLNISNFDTSNKNLTYYGIFENVAVLNNIIVGKNTIFKDETGLPDTTADWVEIGNGTIKNPKPTVPAISISKLLLTTHEGTWVKAPGAKIIKDKVPNYKTVVLTSNLYPKGKEVAVPKAIVPDYEGAELQVPAPVISGYTAEPTSVWVKSDETKLAPFYEDGKTPQYDITYTKDKTTPSHHTSGNTSHHTDSNTSHTVTPTRPTINITNSSQYITVDSTVKTATLYDTNGQKISTDALARNTNWRSDKILTIGKDKYYRVATDEFVKATDVYVYQPVSDIIETHDQEVTNLDTFDGQLITNRGLGSLTKWKANKTTIINGQKYYSVSTDEFVKASDVDLIN